MSSVSVTNWKTYIIPCLLIAGLAAVLFKFDFLQFSLFQKETSISTLKPDRVAPDERLLVSVNPSSIKTIFPDSVVYMPKILQVHDGNLYLSDHGKQQIIRYSLDGEFVNAIGNGVGDGPGEILDLSDFVIADTVVWSVGPNSHLLNKFTVDGIYLDRYEVSPLPERIAIAGDSLVVHTFGSTNPFKIFSRNGEIGATFGGKIPEQSRNIIATSGTLVGTSGSSLIAFLPYYASYIFLYEDRAAPFVTQTFDRLPFPGGETSPGSTGGTLMRAPKQSTFVRGGSIDGELLYINTRYDSFEPTKHSVIDIFSLPSAQYERSYKLPYSILGMDVDDGIVYGIKDTTIVSFDARF